MSKVSFVLDGRDVEAASGQSILEAAADAGIYIPRLCYHKDLVPGGHCRVCSVKVNGKVTNACTMPAMDGMVVESDTEELATHRRRIIEMLFVEGNHFCPTCEKSGSCELQALGYRLGMVAPTYPYLFQKRGVDATHPQVFIDRNRCVLCGRCVRASRDRDHKGLFGFEGRGVETRIAVESLDGLGDTALLREDAAAAICPTGSIVIKRVGFATPYGKRLYDRVPIGSEIEKRES